MRYKSKFYSVEAFQLDSRPLIEEPWFWEAVTRNEIITFYFGRYYMEPACCEIFVDPVTKLKANTGDWIIKDPEGKIFTLPDSLFKLIYHPVTVKE